MILLSSGILCGAAAVFLLIQIRKIHNSDASQAKKKFYWLYWSILMVLCIRNTFQAFSIGWLENIVSFFGIILFYALPIIGFFLAISLRTEDKLNHKST